MSCSRVRVPDRFYVVTVVFMCRLPRFAKVATPIEFCVSLQIMRFYLLTDVMTCSNEQYVSQITGIVVPLMYVYIFGISSLHILPQSCSAYLYLGLPSNMISEEFDVIWITSVLMSSSGTVESLSEHEDHYWRTRSSRCALDI